MIVYLEFDWRGSWWPRRNHIGGLLRWIAGPVALAITPGGFNDLLGAIKADVEEKLAERTAVALLERRGTPGDMPLDSSPG